jgi:hypothetical protein
MHYIYLGVLSLHIVIDHVEQRCEEQSELAPADDANPEQDQGKLRCI